MKKLISIMTLLLMLTTSFQAQESVTVKFTANNAEGTYHPFKTVTATNLTRGWTETLTYPDTVLVLYNTVGVDEKINLGFKLGEAYPTPSSEETYAILNLSEDCNAQIQVIGFDGTMIVNCKQQLDAGTYRIKIRLSTPQMALLVVTTPKGQQVSKLIQTSNCGENTIDVSLIAAREDNTHKSESVRNNTIGEFTPGDVMRYQAQFANNGDSFTITSETVTQQQFDDETVILLFLAPTGAINGKFTINSNGDKVYFSRGNLQFNAVGAHAVAPYGSQQGTWRFATNQYDYIGSANCNISSLYDGWIDLYGWGTSGWPCGNWYYQPWDYDNTDGSYYGPTSPWGPYAYYNLTGDCVYSDWGVYNAISNGGNQCRCWRTLLKEEWIYITQTRNTDSGIRYAKAQIIISNNEIVNGLILLPDDWDTTYYTLLNTDRSNMDYGANYSDNVITLSQWENDFQIHGAIFLPAAGSRNGTVVHDSNNRGYYWSASWYQSDNNPCGASVLKCDDIYVVNPSMGMTRYIGCSVRLVCPVE